jgi:hypothetical protein
MVTEIIQGCVSKRLRACGMEKIVPLDELIQLGRSYEAVETQMKVHDDMKSNQDERANQITRNWKSKRNDAHGKESIQTCRNCGGEYPHIQRKRTAVGKACNKCSKLNHFARYCKSSQLSKAKRDSQRDKTQSVNKLLSIQDEDVDAHESDDYVWTVQGIGNKLPQIRISLLGANVNFTIDTGATVNIIVQDTFERLPSKPRLKKSKTRIFGYDNESLMTIIEEFQARIAFGCPYYHITFMVVKGRAEL